MMPSGKISYNWKQGITVLLSEFTGGVPLKDGACPWLLLSLCFLAAMK
jgi:hypothetical protein